MLIASLAAPLWSQAVQFEDAKLLATGGQAGDLFGLSVCLFDDTLLVGADGAGATGSAYVFTRRSSRWVEEAVLVPSGVGSVNFGFSVAVHCGTAVVGAPGDDELGINRGAAHVFVHDGESWVEQIKLLPDVGAGGQFGAAVAIDGDTIVVGALLAAPGGIVWAGEAYVFVRDGTSWSQQAYLVASDAGEFQCFGEKLTLSGDTLAIEASPMFGVGPGATYVFERVGTRWTELPQQLPAGLPVLSGDTLAVRDEVYVRQGGTWELQAELAPSGGSADAVALDGDVCILSDCGGSAYVFTRSGTAWSEQVVLAASDPGVPSDFLGWPGASVFGDTVVLGASSHDALGSNAGAAYVYSIELPECFLVIGQTPGASPFTGAAHVFETQVGPVVEEAHAVLMESIPEFVLPPVVGDVPALTGQGAARGGPTTSLIPPGSVTPDWLLDGQVTVQVLLWNPAVFPQQPEQSSTALVVRVLPDGSVLSQPVGLGAGDLSVWAEVAENAQGQRVLRFPFQVGGL